MRGLSPERPSGVRGFLFDGLRERDHRERAVRTGAAVGVAVGSRALLTCAAS